MKNKMIVILLLFALFISLIGCSSDTATPTDTKTQSSQAQVTKEVNSMPAQSEITEPTENEKQPVSSVADEQPSTSSQSVSSQSSENKVTVVCGEPDIYTPKTPWKDPIQNVTLCNTVDEYLAFLDSGVIHSLYVQNHLDDMTADYDGKFFLENSLLIYQPMGKNDSGISYKIVDCYIMDSELSFTLQIDLSEGLLEAETHDLCIVPLDKETEGVKNIHAVVTVRELEYQAQQTTVANETTYEYDFPYEMK